MRKLIGIVAGAALATTLAVIPAASAHASSAATGWGQAGQIEARISPPQIPNRDYDVTEFGAVGDGKTDARPAIQAAIAAASGAGGGRVVLPAGTWWSAGPIRLQSNVDLHVSQGATLRFTDDTEAYLPEVLTRRSGVEFYGYSPLIYAFRVSNVAITGKGTIDGNGKSGFLSAPWFPLEGEALDRLWEMGAEGVPVGQRHFGEGEYRLRPDMIEFFDATNVMMDGVTVINSPAWVNHLTYVKNAIIRGITVNSGWTNNDGVDVDSSTDVLIDHNTLLTGDDGVSIKSGRNEDGWRVGKPTENVIVRNNVIGGALGVPRNGLAIGSEMSGGVSNIFMEDNTLLNANNAIYLKSSPDRGGYVENVWVRDINVEQAYQLINSSMDWSKGGVQGAWNPPVYRNFIFENIKADHVDRSGRAVIQVTGVAGAPPVTDVVVRNVHVQDAGTPLDTQYVQNLQLKDVWMNGQRVQM